MIDILLGIVAVPLIVYGFGVVGFLLEMIGVVVDYLIRSLTKNDN